MTADEKARYEEMVELVAWLRDQLSRAETYALQLEGKKVGARHTKFTCDLVVVEEITTRVYRREDYDERRLAAELQRKIDAMASPADGELSVKMRHEVY